MNSDPQPPRPVRQVLVWTWWWLTPIILIALFYQVENWRGERAWQQEKERLIAQGQSLDIQDYLPLPKAVPDELNAATLPVFSDRSDRLIDSVGMSLFPPDLNPSIGKLYDATMISSEFATNENLVTLLDDLRLAVQKPYARWPISWKGGIGDALATYQRLQSLTNLLLWRACSRIGAREGEEALLDILTILRLAEFSRGPNLFCEANMINIVDSASEAVWFGVASQVWADQQLAQLGESLNQLNLIPHLLRSLRGERAFRLTVNQRSLNDPRLKSLCCEVTPTQKLVKTLMPSGWWLQLQVFDSLECQRLLVDLTNKTIQKGCLTASPIDDSRESNTSGVGKRLSGYLESEGLSVGYSDHSTRVTLANVALAQAAISIERHRLSHGSLPEVLSPSLPPDPASGAHLHYARQDNYRYKLWSVGDNGIDDGGDNTMGKYRSRALDWVWVSHISSPPASPR